MHHAGRTQKLDLMLTQELTYLQGVGSRRAEFLKKNGVATCRDLLYYFPRRYLDRTTTRSIRELSSGDEEVTVIGTLRVVGEVTRGRRRLEAFLEDEGGRHIKLVWFNRYDWVKRFYRPGDRLAVWGKVQRFGHYLSIPHPEMDRLDEDGPMLSTGRIIALYPGGALFTQMGLTSKAFRKIIYNLIKTRGLQMPEEILPLWVVKKYELLNWRTALRAMHFPRTHDELDRARHRLKFEELFFLQLMLALSRRRRRRQKATILEPGNAFVDRYVDLLPFSLTEDQKRALRDIEKDTASGYQMSRMLQGDVGSGKTVVAIAALLRAVGAGFQAAIMAPTEVLAEQHHKTLLGQLDSMEVRLSFLVGGQRKKERERVLADIENGQSNIVVGTHAIFQEKVRFRNLALAVIDEQHRFGVQQRASLQEKGDHPHILLMTATPIPRSLALTVYGDLDISVMKELPAGRKPVRTWLFSEKRREEMMAHVHDEVAKGRQAYIIYPQVEESESTDLKDAESGFRTFSNIFRDFKVGLVHGKMASEVKEAVMDRFKAGETDILVATTVIEVGIDAPNATIMVIEHAERFGLSQLHQLRGRVGRGKHASQCILMADYRQTSEARQRLMMLTRTTDGFKISDKDLAIRGGGDFFGTRQHGLPSLKIADVAEDSGLVIRARQATDTLLERDPDLREHQHDTLLWYYDTFVGSRVGRLFRVG